MIRRAREGSAAAFGELAALHQDRLYRFLLSRCGTRADAEDAMQEAFISAYRYIASYDPRWRFTTWLYRIALRELGRVRGRGDTMPLAKGSDVDAGADPLAACMAEDQRENLWLTARAHLGEQAFTALWLRYAEDLPVRDVARVMGRPATWVKVVVHRAKRRLARCVETPDQRAEAEQSKATSARSRKNYTGSTRPAVVKETAR